MRIRAAVLANNESALLQERKAALVAFAELKTYKSHHAFTTGRHSVSFTRKILLVQALLTDAQSSQCRSSLSPPRHQPVVPASAEGEGTCGSSFDHAALPYRWLSGLPHRPASLTHSPDGPAA